MTTAGPVDPITVVDLFAGCGGFTQGFHEFRPEGLATGDPVFRSISAVEHDKFAAATYAANFGSLSERPPGGAPVRLWVDDIEDWKPTGEDQSADVVIGGPPCQGFSALNRAKKGLDRNSLWREYVRGVVAIKPKIFVIENVDRFLKSVEFQDLLEEVAPNGVLADYRLVDPSGDRIDDPVHRPVSRYLLNAADYGAVQVRRRAIVLGVRRDLPFSRSLRYPAPTHASQATSPYPAEAYQTALFPVRQLPAWRAVRSVFEESADLHLRTGLPEREVFFPEINDMIPGLFETRDLFIGRNPHELSRARYRAIPPGGSRSDLRDKWYTMDEAGEIQIYSEAEPAGVLTPLLPLSTQSWDDHHNGAADVMGRLWVDQPSVTIRTEFFKPEKGRYLHPSEHRPLTHYEGARIQGFPLDYRWCGTKAALGRQIGNAVPTALGRAIASTIFSCLRG